MESEIKSEKVLKKFGSKPIRNKKDKMETKMESYKGKIKTDFCVKEMPYKGFQYICL